jgi:hypothetical protein
MITVTLACLITGAIEHLVFHTMEDAVKHSSKKGKKIVSVKSK